MDTLQQDIRHAFRRLFQNPGFTIVAVLTLALGIGANSAIFSVVNGVLLRPLPYPHAERIVQLWGTTRDEPRNAFAAADFLDLKRDATAFDAVAATRGDAFNLTEGASEPVRVEGSEVTVAFFDVFGMPAALGRTFSEKTDRPEAERLVVLADKPWREHFASDPSVVGRRIRLNGQPYTVTGVMPPAFDWPEGASAWVLAPRAVPTPPLHIEGDLFENRDVHYFQPLARLRPGVTIEQARSAVRLFGASLEQRFPQTNSGRGINVVSVREQLVGDVRRALLVLLGAVGFVLLIACANVASLLLARASGRQRELATRSALGAGRWRLVRQLLTESLLLATAGGALGLLLGVWIVALLVRVMPESVPRVHEIGLDASVAGWTALISIATGLIFGTTPALHGSRVDLTGALKEGGERGATSGGRGVARNALIVGEVALTLVLLVGAGLLANSFLRLQRVDPGFNADHVTVAHLFVPQSRYPDVARQAHLYGRLLDGLQAQRSIETAAVVFPTPLEAANASGSFTIEGRPTSRRADRPFATLSMISPAFFRTLGIPLVAGRAFTDQDADKAPAVAIVSAALARKYWPGETVVGQRVRFGDSADEDWVTIVAVAADTRNLGLAVAPPPTIYLPYRQFSLPFMTLLVRSSADTATVVSTVRSHLKAIDAELPLGEIQTLGRVLDESVSEPRFRTVVLAGFAVMALLLAAVGVYGLISYTVTDRVREIGIRLALGATPRQVIVPIVRKGLVLSAVGLAAGLVGAFAATRALEGLLFGVRPTDPPTFAAVSLLLLLVAVTASYIPARRATRIDPVAALRAE